MEIPSRVLEAAGDPGGGQLVIVMGAGCSIEPPTSLPNSQKCSRDLWQKLVDDQVLSTGDCTNPDDLSSVADAVYAKFGSQAELVKRLPSRFHFAEPNDGSLLAAALLREGIAHHVVTLNIDLTMRNALVNVGTDAKIRVLERPEDHGQMGDRNLVYLHRNVQADDPDTLVLRTEALEDAWKDGWEEVIAHVALSAPVVIFAGLGTEVGVLVASAERLKNVLDDAVTLVQVDIGARDNSVYAAKLDIDEHHFVSAGWSEFMRALGGRVSLAQSRALNEAANDLVTTEGVAPENAGPLLDRLAASGLMYLGELRAKWTLDPDRRYCSADEVDGKQVADLILGIALIERESGSDAYFVDGGLIELRREGSHPRIIAVGSGRGSSAYLTAETRLRGSRGAHPPSATRPAFGVLAHVKDRPQSIAPPPNIVPEPDAMSIISPSDSFPIFTLEDIRKDAAQALALLSAA